MEKGQIGGKVVEEIDLRPVAAYDSRDIKVNTEQNYKGQMVIIIFAIRTELNPISLPKSL